MSRILIVEDDPAILVGLKDNLEFESHQVLTAADGEAGYRSVCENSPELVILDLMLPELSGYDLCRRVRGKFLAKANSLLFDTTNAGAVRDGFLRSLRRAGSNADLCQRGTLSSAAGPQRNRSLAA